MNTMQCPGCSNTLTTYTVGRPNVVEPPKVDLIEKYHCGKCGANGYVDDYTNGGPHTKALR